MKWIIEEKGDPSKAPAVPGGIERLDLQSLNSLLGSQLATLLTGNAIDGTISEFVHIAVSENSLALAEKGWRHYVERNKKQAESILKGLRAAGTEKSLKPTDFPRARTRQLIHRALIREMAIRLDLGLLWPREIRRFIVERLTKGDLLLLSNVTTHFEEMIHARAHWVGNLKDISHQRSILQTAA